MDKEDYDSTEEIEKQICNRKLNINEVKIICLKTKEVMIKKFKFLCHLL